MTYALIQNDAVAKYPLTLEQLRRIHPDLPADFDLASEAAIELGVVTVHEGTQPELAEGQTLDEGLPVNNNGVWLRNWIVHDWLTIEPGGFYARIDGEDVTYPYTARDVRRDFNVAARYGAIAQMDGEWGVVPVEAVPMPQTEPGEIAEQTGIDEYEPGKWRQVWTIRDMSPEEKAALVPQSVSMRQARLMALNAGILDAIEGFVATLGDAAKIEWEYAQEVRRDHPLIETLGSMLQLDKAGIDALFIAAAQID